MYKEFRNYGSSPLAWASPFMESYSSFIHTVKIFSLTIDVRWRQILHRISHKARVLDAGCGLGEWVIFMGKKGLHSCGLDYSEEMISFLKRKHPEQEWLKGIIQDIPVPSGSFDAVISWGVIEHDEEGPQKTLREFHRILKAGGYLFLTVPIDSPSQRKSSMLSFNKPEDVVFFQYFFTPEELKTFVRQAGFQVEIVIPVSKHYALVFPEGYRRLISISPFLSRIVGLLLKPVITFCKEAQNMFLAVAKKS